MLMLEAFLLLASLAVAAAASARLWTRRRPRGGDDRGAAGPRKTAATPKVEPGAAGVLPSTENLWLEFEARLERRRLRYPYKG